MWDGPVLLADPRPGSNTGLSHGTITSTVSAGERSSCVEVQIRVDAPDAADELRALRQWLSAEDEFRGRVALRGGTPRPGDMGPVVDLLTVAVSSGGAATVLAGTLAVWLRNRRSDVSIEISETEEGRTVKVTGNRVGDAEALIREVLGQVE